MRTSALVKSHWFNTIAKPKQKSVFCKQESEAAECAKIARREKERMWNAIKAERENRFKAAAENRRQEMTTSDENAIVAAIARVKAQKEQATATSDSTVKPAVAAAIANRRKQNKQKLQNRRS